MDEEDAWQEDMRERRNNEGVVTRRDVTDASHVDHDVL
jgi:hypothetical protein